MSARRRFAFVALIAITAGACNAVVGGCVSRVLREAIDEVAPLVQRSRPHLVGKLRSCANPKGQGIVVFVRSESDCGPGLGWLWIGRSHIYALDDPSRAVTPTLGALDDGAGRDSHDNGRRIRASVRQRGPRRGVSDAVDDGMFSHATFAPEWNTRNADGATGSSRRGRVMSFADNPLKDLDGDPIRF